MLMPRRERYLGVAVELIDQNRDLSDALFDGEMPDSSATLSMIACWGSPGFKDKSRRVTP